MNMEAGRYVAHYDDELRRWQICRIGSGGIFGAVSGHDNYLSYTDAVKAIEVLEQADRASASKATRQRLQPR